jgi:hypothetical protein
MLPGEYAYNKLCCLAGYSDLLCITVAGDDLGGCGVENKHLLIALLIRTETCWFTLFGQ